MLRAPAVSLPARALAVLLAATRMDVLDEEVYTWRAGSAARGLSADTDPVGLLAEVDALAQLAADAPDRHVVVKGDTPTLRRRCVGAWSSDA